MHEVLVNRLGGLSLPRKSVVRLTDRPDMTLDVYRGRKTTIQQILNTPSYLKLCKQYVITAYILFPDISAREHGSNKQVASKSCALSLVRQLYHMKVIEAYTGQLKKKEGDKVISDIKFKFTAYNISLLDKLDLSLCVLMNAFISQYFCIKRESSIWAQSLDLMLSVRLKYIPQIYTCQMHLIVIW